MITNKNLYGEIFRIILHSPFAHSLLQTARDPRYTSHLNRRKITPFRWFTVELEYFRADI